MAVIIKGDNGTVTDTYLELIGQALTDLGETVSYVTDIREVRSHPKDELIVSALTRETFHLILHGYRRIILWFQGLAAEETFMVTGSRLKLAALSLMEWFVVRHVDFMLFVSETMKNYILKKYRISPAEDRIYCMPCMNTELHPESFFAEHKYDAPTFAYVGSLTVWQAFEETAELYAQIEQAFGSRSKLMVFTGYQEQAEQILKAKGVQNYTISYVPNEKLPEALAAVKYGFIIRRDDIVNRVATPTKISTYLSCGVIPIYSRCLEDFDSRAQEMTYVISDSGNIIEKIGAMESRKIDPGAVLAEYRQLFGSYYNRELHLENLKKKLAFSRIFR